VLAEKLKAVGIPATCIQAKGGMNSWTNVWLRSFGAQMFKPGDWTKVAINSAEALKGLAYIQTIIDKGYTTPPLETNDDDLVELYTTGKVFSGTMQNGHTDYWVSKDEARNKLVADLVARLSGYESQWYFCTITGGFPTLKNFAPAIGMASKDSYKAIAKLSATAGSYKEYPDGEKGAEVRRLWNTYSEQWVRGKLSAKEFLATFETEANKVLR
jgi:ABC-type glycerol-3-phosphate transport system substrate-binding protein